MKCSGFDGGGVLKNRDRDRPQGDAEMVNYRKIFRVETNLGYVEAKAPGVEAKTAGAVKNDDHLPVSQHDYYPTCGNSFRGSGIRSSGVCKRRGCGHVAYTWLNELRPRPLPLMRAILKIGRWVVRILICWGCLMPKAKSRECWKQVWAMAALWSMPEPWPT